MAYDIPQTSRTAKGQALVNFLQLAPNEKVSSLLAMKDLEKIKYLVMVTTKGLIKKTAVEDFANVRKSGLIAIKLKTDDDLQWVKPSSSSDDIVIATKLGQAIRFKEKDVRAMGRGASGVRAIRLKSSDEVIGMDVFEGKDSNLEFLTIGQNGLGKLTAIGDYKVQNRGGSGIKTAKVTPKTGNIIHGSVVDKVKCDHKDILMMSNHGQVIRMPFSSIPSTGRATQGVRLMRFKEEGDHVANVTLVEKEETLL
jgi:DNA gyrase subunit A